MKPERIQLTATPPGPTWGVYQTFQFDTFRHLLAFSTFVELMAANHGREVSCDADPALIELTVKVPVGGLEQATGAQVFLGTVVAIHLEWSVPVAEES